MRKIHRVDLARGTYIAGRGVVTYLIVEEGKTLRLEPGTVEDTEVPAILVRYLDMKTDKLDTAGAIPMSAIDFVHYVDHGETQAIVNGKPLSQHREEAAEEQKLRAHPEARAKAVADAEKEKHRQAIEAQKEFNRQREEAAKARKAAERAAALPPKPAPQQTGRSFEK
jgi:hypothetical protein